MLRDPQVSSLRFAVRGRVIARHLGQLFVPLAALLAVPTVVWIFTAPSAAAMACAGTVGVLGLVSVACARVKSRTDVQGNEAMVITTLAFCIVPALLAVPLVGLGLPWVDALFQTVSGITTTGLTTATGDPARGFDFAFFSAWLQWIGGLGVVVLALAILVHSTPALRRMGIDERETESLAGGTRAHARHVLMVYSTLTLLAFALLLATPTGPADALLHALAAVSTGGFSPHPDSAGGLHGWWSRAVICGASLAGAISFSFYYRGLYRKPGALIADEGLRTLIVLVAAGICAVWLLERASGSGVLDDPRDAAFLVISAQSTTGFSTVDTASLTPASKLVLIGSMLVGGDVGSTAGGLKILRFLILLRLLELVIARASVARGTQLVIRADGQPVTPREIELTAALLIAHLLLVALSWLAFLAAGEPALDSLFDVVSAVSLTGLSTGVVSPELPAGLKLLLCADMLAGRVETIGLLIVLYPGTWLGRRREAA